MEYYLDTKGYECPIPVLKTAKRIKKLKKNDLITVESDDPLSKYDFKNYCVYVLLISLSQYHLQLPFKVNRHEISLIISIIILFCSLRTFFTS